MPGVAVSLFEKKEKYDKPYSGRAPTALLARVKQIAEKEEESENQARAKLWLLGSQAYEWMLENRQFVDAIKREHQLFTNEVLPRILDLAKQAYGKGKK